MKQVVGPLALAALFVGMAVGAEGCELFKIPAYDDALDRAAGGNGGDGGNGGSTVANLPNGAKCALDGDCQNRMCRDGVCCDTNCNGPCEACNLPENEGKCSATDNGSEDPACNEYSACNGNRACAFVAGMKIAFR